MKPSWTPADVTRVLDLLAKPLVLEILDGIGHGREPDTVLPPGVHPTVLAEAIEYLWEIGGITALDSARPTRELTPRGRRLLVALERVSAAMEAQETCR